MKPVSSNKSIVTDAAKEAVEKIKQLRDELRIKKKSRLSLEEKVNQEIEGRRKIEWTLKVKTNEGYRLATHYKERFRRPPENEMMNVPTTPAEPSLKVFIS